MSDYEVISLILYILFQSAILIVAIISLMVNSKQKNSHSSRED